MLKRKKNKRKIVKNNEYKAIIKLNLYHQNRMNYWIEKHLNVLGINSETKVHGQVKKIDGKSQYALDWDKKMNYKHYIVYVISIKRLQVTIKLI